MQDICKTVLYNKLEDKNKILFVFRNILKVMEKMLTYVEQYGKKIVTQNVLL